jgi:hypothetical protein
VNCSKFSSKSVFILAALAIFQSQADAQQWMSSITVYGGGSGDIYGGVTYSAGMSYATQTMMAHVAAGKIWSEVRNVACSGGVYKNITSKDDEVMRQLAAETLFRFASTKETLFQRFFGGQMAVGKSFDVTYADGGTESWLIVSVLGSIALAMPHNFNPGSGEPSGCPHKG